LLVKGIYNGQEAALDKHRYFIKAAKKKIMENTAPNNEIALYRVHDEMAFEDIMETSDLQEARNAAYNYQCILIDNLTGRVIHDYSCY